jgi:cell division protein FtsW (lipid II flippase)
LNASIAVATDQVLQVIVAALAGMVLFFASIWARYKDRRWWWPPFILAIALLFLALLLGVGRGSA